LILTHTSQTTPLSRSFKSSSASLRSFAAAKIGRQVSTLAFLPRYFCFWTSHCA
jgi:hypothetical protein